MITSQQAEKLLKGQYAFELWAFSVLLTQLKNDYAASPTQENLEQCVEKINAFITKYQGILSKDLAVIQGI